MLGTAAPHCPSRRYHAVVRRTTCATLLFLLPARGGRASSDFFKGARLQPRSISARVRQGNRHPAFVNSNLLESRTKHPHLHFITMLASSVRGNRQCLRRPVADGPPIPKEN